MSVQYTLRELADGQAEVVEVREAVIGTFVQVDHARQFCEMLNHLTAPKPARPAPEPAAAYPRTEKRQAERDERTDATNAEAPMPPAPAPVPSAVAVEKPAAPVKMCADLGEEVMNPAFERLERGEKLQAVAADLSVPWPSLRGAYAGYKGRRQREIARGGMATCSLCSKEFMPSVTSPDTCARCTRTMER